MTDTDTTPSPGPSLPMTLRAVAAWLESHPEVDVHEVALGHYVEQRVSVYGLDADRMGKLAREIGGRWDKHVDELLFTLKQEIAPGVALELTASRERVCERVVTGTTIVTEPDPEALAAVPTVTREVETFEWRCAPLLAEAAA